MGAVLVWGVPVLVAYALERREILSLARSLGALASLPANDATEVAAALGRGVAAICVALAVLLACYGFGRILATWVRPPRHLGRAFGEACAFALGTGVGAFAIFVAGHLGALTRGVAVALTVAGLVALVASLRADATALWRSAGYVAGTLRRDAHAWPWLLVLVALAPVALGIALAPITARDPLVYHLAAPKAYLAAGAIVELPASVHSYLPFNAEMHFTWALLLGSETAANLVHLGFGVAVLVVLYAVAARVTGRPALGAIAAALFAAIPSAVWNAAIAHNEMSMSLYMLVGIVSLATWVAEGDRRAMLWFGIALGLALATKHTALFFGPAAAVAVLVRVYRSEEAARARALADAVVAATAAFAIAAPWYVRNAVWTGNPIYPYFWNLFPTRHELWDAGRAEVFELYLRSTYGTSGSVAGMLALPWEVSVRAVDNVPRYFDGILGPAFLILTPFVVFAVVRARAPWDAALRAMAGLVALGLVIWAGQSQQIRFLLPFVTVGAILGAAAIAALAPYRIAQAAIVGVVGLAVALNVLAAAAPVVAANPFHVTVGLESRERYLTRRLAHYRFYELLEREMAPGDRVFLVDIGNDTYHLDRPFFSDSVLEHYTLASIVARASSPAEIDAALRSFGASHLLVGEDILLDPAYTPFGPDEAARWNGFLRAYTRRIATDGRITLYAMKETN